MTDDTKLPLTSLDFTDALLTQLREAAPQVFSEGRVDFAKLQAALGEHIETGAERYGLNWAGKREAFRNVQIPSVAALRPQPEESVNWGSTENLIIEGDNLEVLKLLQKPYHGKVKMIYIDPPYNTGNEFIYPDNYREGLDDYLRYTGQLSSDNTATSTNKDTSGRYHSNWLNMMYPRLFLARNLLKEDGVIFVSIDDHEVHNLRLLMDEVFGEENFLPPIVRRAKIGGGSDNKQIAREVDYVLGAARNIEALPKFFLPHTEKDLKRYSQQDEKGRFFWDTYSRSGLASDDPESDSLVYEVKFPDGTVRSDRWRRSESRLKLDIKENEAKYVRTQNGWNIHFKQRLNNEGKRPRQVLYDGMGNTEGSEDIESVWPEITFSYPKPTSLIKHLAKICGTENAVILDFFAGSGTTAHAVLDLNQQDNGNRRFILVQLPEKTDNPQYPTIAHITRERVRRVIAKLQPAAEIPPSPPFAKGGTTAGGLFAEQATDAHPPLQKGGRGDLGFRAFKLDSSNFKIWQADAAAKTTEQLAEQLTLYADNVQAGRSEQDRLYELVLKSGFPLSAKIDAVAVGDKTAFAVADGTLLICLSEHLDQATLRALFARNPQMVLCLDTAFDGNDALKTNTVLEAQTHGIIFKTV